MAIERIERRDWRTMNGKTTLKRLERLVDGLRAQQDEAERRERERLDAMTDEELARDVAAFARVLKLVEEWQREG